MARTRALKTASMVMKSFTTGRICDNLIYHHKLTTRRDKKTKASVVLSTADHLSWQPSRISWNEKCAILQRLKASSLVDRCLASISEPEHLWQDGKLEGKWNGGMGKGNWTGVRKIHPLIQLFLWLSTAVRRAKPPKFQPLRTTRRKCHCDITSL